MFFGPRANNDPLGISTQQRSTAGALQGLQGIQFGADPFGIQRNAAMQSYQASATDPMRFETMMQAVKENAPGGIRPSRPSRFMLPEPPSTMWQPGQTSAMTPQESSGLPNSPLGLPSTMWQPRQQSAVTGRPFDPGQAFQGLKGAR